MRGHANGSALRLNDTDANAQALANKLRSLGTLKVVFINGCASRGQVAYFHAAGIPFVVATSRAVNDEKAFWLAKQFYEYLSKGHSVREAFDEVVNDANLQQINIPFGSSRDMLKITEAQDDSFAWGLYVREGSEKENYFLPLGDKDALTAKNVVKKNVVERSNISAGGDVHIGDKTLLTESETSRRLRVFLYAFVPILAISFAFLYNKNEKLKESLNLTVVVKDATPNPNIPFEKATITLNYGDKTEPQTVEKEATFKGIPPKFRGEKVSLHIESEGFSKVDTSIILSENNVNIPLSRDNSLGTIFGDVKDENGRELADVEIRVQDISVRSSVTGYFQLPIPFEKQLKNQRINISKQGFKNWNEETPVLQGTPVNIILKKQP